MISAKQAQILANHFSTKVVLESESTVNEIITTASKMGYETVTIWTTSNLATKLKPKLRKLGFNTRRFDPKMFPDSCILDISWTTASYIPDYETEVE